MFKLIVANLKMNLTKKEIINYIIVVERHNFENLIICPSNIHLELFHNTNLIIGAQNGFHINSGAYTGEVSFEQLKDYVEYCIIGHSERRKMFNESNIDISKKIESCINSEIVPILCVGETLEQYEENSSINVIHSQLKNLILKGNIIIAYEPVFSIGTNVTPPEQHIRKIHKFIKDQMKYMYNLKVKVLYGGSVNKNNINNICNLEEVDGALIGGASNDPNSLINILNNLKL